MSEEVVLDYQAVYERGGNMPPITLFFDGERYWLGDGFHRVESRLRASNGNINPTIDAEVQRGTQRDALLHALKANGSHGLRRSNADKRRVVETMLRDDEWVTWSNRKVAEHCGVSDPFAGKIREELGLPEPEGRVGIDGRTREVPPEPAAEPRTKATANRSQLATERGVATGTDAPGPSGREFETEILAMVARLEAVVRLLSGAEPRMVRVVLTRIGHVLEAQERILNLGAARGTESDNT